MPTIPFPDASSDRGVLAELFETVRYARPDEPFERDEHGLPVRAPEPDDPDDE
jgi:hypothetical protein